MVYLLLYVAAVGLGWWLAERRRPTGTPISPDMLAWLSSNGHPEWRVDIHGSHVVIRDTHGCCYLLSEPDERGWRTAYGISANRLASLHPDATTNPQREVQ